MTPAARSARSRILAADCFRKGGAHGRSKKAQRARDKQQLRRDAD